jgi:hypothetical protein
MSGLYFTVSAFKYGCYRLNGDYSLSELINNNQRRAVAIFAQPLII